MDFFIYSDESGVFDREHNSIFVFGGIIFLDKESKDSFERKYKAIENDIRARLAIPSETEIKAAFLSNHKSERSRLFSAANGQIRFGVVINQSLVNENIFASKKDKQRFLDYAYKIAVKRCFENLISNGRINPKDEMNLHFYCDEHCTATNGRYELREGLEQEFINGTYNYNYNKYFEPIFPNAKSVSVDFRSSSKTPLIRAADIIANAIFRKATGDSRFQSRSETLLVTRLPY